MNVQIRDNGSFVARVDRVGRVARCLVQSVVPLEKGSEQWQRVEHFKKLLTSGVSVAPAGTSITACDTGWWYGLMPFGAPIRRQSYFTRNDLTSVADDIVGRDVHDWLRR